MPAAWQGGAISSTAQYGLDNELYMLGPTQPYTYRNIRRFPTKSGQPAYTSTLTLKDLHFIDGKFRSVGNAWNYGHVIHVQMEVFGCKDYTLDQKFCPGGWTGGKNACYKVVDIGTDSDFSEAVTACNNDTMGSYPAEPLNDDSHNTLKDVMVDAGTPYWIG